MLLDIGCPDELGADVQLEAAEGRMEMGVRVGRKCQDRHNESKWERNTHGKGMASEANWMDEHGTAAMGTPSP